MFCPECEAEYREGFTLCSDCRVELVPRLAVAKEISGDLELVQIFSTENLSLLAIAESLLEGADLRYLVKGQRLYAAGFPVNRPVWIEVAAEDEEEARAILEPLEESETSED